MGRNLRASRCGRIKASVNPRRHDPEDRSRSIGPDRIAQAPAAGAPGATREGTRAMTAFDVRDILKTAVAQQAGQQAGMAEGHREALPPAEAVVPGRAGPALSPVVLAGCVRGLEFVLVAAAGFAVQIGLL